LNYACRCTAKNPAVTLNDEGQEFRWLKPVAAKNLKLNKPTKILLDAVIKNSRPAERPAVTVKKKSLSRKRHV
jgi:hypothetical protein